MNPHPSTRTAFSIIELLVVVAIAGILAVFAVPAMSSLAGSASITQGGDLVAGELESARQLADVRGRPVEVRLLANPEGAGFSAIQLWWEGSNTTAASKAARLPRAIVVRNDPDLSPWITDMRTGTMPTGGPWSGVSYRAFSIRPAGAIDPAPAAAARTNRFLTIAPDRSGSPDNFVTIQVNPDTSRPLIYRP